MVIPRSMRYTPQIVRILLSMNFLNTSAAAIPMMNDTNVATAMLVQSVPEDVSNECFSRL